MVEVGRKGLKVVEKTELSRQGGDPSQSSEVRDDLTRGAPHPGCNGWGHLGVEWGRDTGCVTEVYSYEGSKVDLSDTNRNKLGSS